MERVHGALGPSWDWSGAAAAPAPVVPQEGLVNGAPSSSEEARERGDVQRAYYSFLHTLTTASLSPCLFQVPPPLGLVCLGHARLSVFDVFHPTQYY